MYVIYLKTNSGSEMNEYGYYAGKRYIVQGEEYPITDRSIVERTKVYKSEIRAINGGILALERYGYVVNFEIHTIDGTVVYRHR